MLDKQAYLEGYTYTTGGDWLERYKGNKLYNPKLIVIKDDAEVYQPNTGTPKPNYKQTWVTHYVNKEASAADELAIPEAPNMVAEAINLVFKEAPGNLGKLFLKKEPTVVDYNQNKLLGERGRWFETALKKIKAQRTRKLNK
jgi:hypothetical protein